MQNINESFLSLKKYCEGEKYLGWDPYDGLNSNVFQALPFKRWELARLAWVQLFKRSPINLRRFFAVEKGYNAKGIALFLSGYCNLYEAQKHAKKEDFGSQAEILDTIKNLANLLLTLKATGYSGACWGYNFDWQSKAFFLPCNTPTVVATSFAVEALLSAYEITGCPEYKETALSSAFFILRDLKRIKKKNGFMFSYSPLDCRAVYNASLLGSKTLSLIFKYHPSSEYYALADESVKAVCATQNLDGSFPHSDQVGNTWRDNFHTGFKLESLYVFSKKCNIDEYNQNIEEGFDYWINKFFDHNSGKAFYYDTQGDLIDLHCAAQAIATLYKLEKIKDHVTLAKSIVEWASRNMQSADGSFYFQKQGDHINKNRYMRWPNAWMFYGMSYYLRNQAENEKN